MSSYGTFQSPRNQARQDQEETSRSRDRGLEEDDDDIKVLQDELLKIRARAGGDWDVVESERENERVEMERGPKIQVAGKKVRKITDEASGSQRHPSVEAQDESSSGMGNRVESFIDLLKRRPLHLGVDLEAMKNEDGGERRAGKFWVGIFFIVLAWILMGLGILGVLLGMEWHFGG
jgi:hypothetical protein